jgi:hypothetical protein
MLRKNVYLHKHSHVVNITRMLKWKRVSSCKFARGLRPRSWVWRAWADRLLEQRVRITLVPSCKVYAEFLHVSFAVPHTLHIVVIVAYFPVMPFEHIIYYWETRDAVLHVSVTCYFQGSCLLVSLSIMQSHLTQIWRLGVCLGQFNKNHSLLYEYDMRIMLYPACNCNDMNDLAPYSPIVSRPRGFILV